MVIGTDYIGSCQSYYHTIMTMMAPREKIYTRALIGVLQYYILSKDINVILQSFVMIVW
jgi:hypothetical protein